MKTLGVILCAIVVFTSCTNGLTTIRKEAKRGDKVSQSFKQLNLPEAEIDPNVSPPLPNPEQVVADAAEVIVSGSAAENEISEVAEEPVEPAEPVSTSPALAEETNPVNEDDPNQISKYCKCSDTHCDCCRNFALPIVPVRGPGCAKITYLGNEKMSVSIKYGDIVLATRTISGKRAKPICVGLPGGFSKFCGRVYGLSKGKEDFKACLGLELRADDEVEASLRVSCFKFGAKGLTVSEAEPLPEVPKDEEEEDDIFGFGAGGSDDDYDDEEDEEEDEEEDDADDDDDDDADTDTDAPADDVDYGGFSFLGSGLLDELEESEETSNPAQQTRTELKDIAQSKDEKGMPLENDGAVLAVDDATNTKPTKVKKNKKKKKKSSDSEFALDILNGILDFFN